MLTAVIVAAVWLVGAPVNYFSFRFWIRDTEPGCVWTVGARRIAVAMSLIGAPLAPLFLLVFVGIPGLFRLGRRLDSDEPASW